ncbi:putative bifunctional diguanylate cyclase/phosphodiesterase [Methylomonas sp. HYX-M1]|uniref:putative bifunctional diguanylate cyclase/phosphodiesterase n=1 Tax=Methylomonas sp. HYX-M1 TaxID=3139307 RepID=UPI00345C301B
MMLLPEGSFDFALQDVLNRNDHFQSITEGDACVGKVASLLLYVEPVMADSGCLQVLQRFVSDETLQAVAIVDDKHNAVGIIDRGKISDIFLRPFSRDLLGKKAISEIMDKQPIVVDIKTGIDDVARIIIDSGVRHMVNGFIIHDRGVYVGMATGLSLLKEITHRKQRELFIMAHYDLLTGLPNRLLFKDRLLQACQNAKRLGHLLALIFVDVDRFKAINDSMGHAFGDKLLQNIASRLAASVRQSDTVARLGGDEFVIVLQNVKSSQDVCGIVGDIAEQLRQPIPIYEREIHVTTSMGIALYQDYQDSAEELVRKADIAMYEVKQRGRNGYLLYAPDMEQQDDIRMSLETQLRMAIDGGELSLYYQPQVDLKQNCMIGVEALLRWNHPNLGSISPAVFIPIAEETGLIIPIGEWALKQAVQQHLEWIAQGLPPLRVAVNISAVQFQADGFADKVRRIVADSGIDPAYLELELTESGVMSRAELAIKTLTDLRALGVKLAIDDFGTGYSSLSYLRRFPIDRIKIDQSFVRDIHNTPANEAIVKAIIALGDSLGLEMLAEGVENQQELAWIMSHHCREAQGYHFAKALSPADLRSWYAQSIVIKCP